MKSQNKWIRRISWNEPRKRKKETRGKEKDQRTHHH